MKRIEQLQQENEILIEHLRRCYVHTAAMQMKGYSVAERRDLAASVHGSIRRTFNQLGIESNP